ncbi:hypothetical protein BDQ17DRAFT_1438551 [Cyathus striatus]|nr:hypothetical protein BDQ17DRAFT_1438551 [Cyathus striatus]
MLEINGGDDVDGEVDEIVPKPTRKEALAASMLLQQYVLDVNDPDAQVLEAALVWNYILM